MGRGALACVKEACSALKLHGKHLLRWFKALLAPLFFIALALYAIWPWLPFVNARAPTRTIIFYGFSITGEAMNEAVFPAFQEKWRRETGESVELVGSFAGSGTITNQLIMGVPADLALLALESDAQRLAAAGVIEPHSWRALPHAGVVNRSPFVVVVRPGNPLGITSLLDLGQPGLAVVHPDPLTSGAANWAILAEYGAGIRHGGGDPAAGVTLLQDTWRNVVAQAASARAALTQFQNGFGDALITYEQDVLLDTLEGGLAVQIVYPPSTILSEHTLVVVQRNVDDGEAELIDGFVAFLWSDEAQRLFADYGFRSVDDEINSEFDYFPAIADPFFVDDFGGWETAGPQIIDAVWKEQVLSEIGR